MSKEFRQLAWSSDLEEDCRRIVRLAVYEDLDRGYDWTTICLVPEEAQAAASVVVRQPGVIAGLDAAPVVLDEMDIAAEFQLQSQDGDVVEAGTVVATIAGPARDLLTSERALLNLIGRLSGIATLTRKYVDAVAGTKARIYDTRKTAPGWRRLEKYAVRCGGGHNHRTGLYDAILIKDNHLAFGREQSGETSFSPSAAVRRAKAFLAEQARGKTPFPGSANPEMIVEIEVDSLDQLREVLPEKPDIVLLDNMSLDQLCEAVSIRDGGRWLSELEASGGVSLQTVRAIAETGVERISAGALTHSAVSLDVALDWK
ncbi:MAG TPA: carboxylating nicotinate-nucleotide diphosphorylase [Pirellulaceae bacterium]|nr:carboxylating nicotinate-nucleotide diphosphorylase [Pirellulaceae bacterium]